MRRIRPGIARLASLALLLLLAAAPPARALERALWLRYPAISPDGRTVAFSYRGNLWKVASTGGVATPLTVGSFYNTTPVWSPDGSRLAFASDRNGNLDVYVMPAEGGDAVRLTTHSSDEIPTSFTPDGKSVLFTASILDAPANAGFPTPAQGELYSVSVEGGRPRQVLTTPANYAVWDRAGKRLAYSDQPGFEMEWRKHDHSNFARQLWMWDAAANKHSRLTAFGADNRQPVWAPGDNALFYLSESSGSFNVWRMDLANPSHPVAVTTHTGSPVRFLSASAAGDLCYAWDGTIWVRPAGATESRRLDVFASADRRERERRPVDVAGQVSEFDVSPDGSEIAFIARGEVFVASAEHGDTRRITDTPEQERSVRFSPDGRSLAYASERGNRWRIYRTSLTDKTEPNFFNATAMKETLLVGGDAEAFQPRWSPDGNEIAYLEDRTAVKVLDLRTGRTRLVLPGDRNYSYADGDQAFEWSPDGRWLAVQFLSTARWSSEVGLVPASGDGKLVNVTNSGYEDALPGWSRKGEVLFWQTDRQGLRNQAGQGRQADVYAAFLTRSAWDRWNLDEAAFDQLAAKEKGKGGKGGGRDSSDSGAPKVAPPVTFDLEHLEDRIARISLASADLSDAQLSPDGETLYYLARVDKGYDLWKYVPRKKDVKIVARLGAREASFELLRDGKKAVVRADSRLEVVELESGKETPVRFTARMDLDAAAERAYLFEHIWRQTFEKFHEAGMHGADWKALKGEYARFLPTIDNSRDFAEMASELQGELNASHTGCRYRPTRTDGDETAALGFFPDAQATGPGVAVAEVIAGGPLEHEGTRIRPGVVIEAIDGETIAAGADWYPLLNHKAGEPVRLSLRDPRDGKRWDEIVHPISWGDQSRLLYLRWTRSRRDAVDKLSGGRLGYAHIRGMNDGAYREVFDEVFGRDVTKDAIVLDTRFNGGGNLVETLTQFLTGRTYATNEPRGRQIGTEPSQRWTKPSIVVMGPGNYSDAHCFPMAYTQLGIGETVGMPVPGTCTSVWWERLQDRDLVFGIPEVTLRDMKGDMMENKQLAPDHLVEPDPAQLAAGRDTQLEAAVEVLLAKLPKR
jgi:tricorn protease